MNDDAPQQKDARIGNYGFLMFLTMINVLNVVDRQLIASMATNALSHNQTSRLCLRPIALEILKSKTFSISQELSMS